MANASATREAIESALPRLRNLLEENGISLGQATVDEQSAEQQADEREAGPFAGESGVDGEKPSAEAETVSAATRVRVAKGLLDTFV